MNDTDLILVRPGKVSDLAQVYAIERTSFSDPWPLDSLRAELHPDPLRLCLVAERNRELLGYLMSWHMGQRLHVLNIAVDVKVRRSGLGSRLLKAATITAARSRLGEMTLEVRRSNGAARAFYRRYGFRERGVRVGYYPNNGEDAVVMSCPLVRLLAAWDAESGPSPA